LGPLFGCAHASCGRPWWPTRSAGSRQRVGWFGGASA